MSSLSKILNVHYFFQADQTEAYQPCNKSLVWMISGVKSQSPTRDKKKRVKIIKLMITVMMTKRQTINKKLKSMIRRKTKMKQKKLSEKIN